METYKHDRDVRTGGGMSQNQVLIEETVEGMKLSGTEGWKTERAITKTNPQVKQVMLVTI